MYIFIPFIVFLLVFVPIFIYKENKKSKKLKEEKDLGLWDFIEYEFLPYLNSHHEQARKLENVSFRIDYRSKSWTLSGILHYNPAGIYVKFDDLSFPNSPSHIFVWGKDKPSRFKPAFELFFNAVETTEDKTVLKLKTKEDLSEADYFLTIKKLPSNIVTELTNVFE